MGSQSKRSTTIRDRARAKLRQQRAACGICGAPIDYSLPCADPKSFVADHIKPLHRGGLDALSNFQAAHRRSRLQQHEAGEGVCAHRSAVSVVGLTKINV